MDLSKWKKSAAVLFCACLLGTAVAGCGSGGTTSTNPNQTASNGQPQIGGTINLDTGATFKDIDPAKSYDTTSDEIVSQMYDQLVTYKGTGTDITGMVAKSWDISQDGKTYTFHLRNDVKFWNGDPCTAQSFIDEFDRLLNANLGSPGEGFLDPIVVGSTAYNKGTAKTVSGLSAPDPYTLVVQLTQPEPFFLQVLAMPFFSAVDQKFIDKVGDKAFDTKDAMGTGPFELASYSDSSATLTRNPNYFMTDKYGNHLPYLNKIVLTMNKDSQLVGMHYEKGQTALLGNNTNGIPSAIYPHFLADPTLSKELVTAPQGAVYYIGMNSQMAPFNNTKVRQAVEYALNKDQINKLMNNRFIVANQPLPPTFQGYVQNMPADVNYTYNPDKAKQLLAESGVKDLSTTLYSANDPDDMKIDTAVQSMLTAVGFTVKIDSMDWNSYLAINEQGKTPIFSLAWIQDFPDPSDFLNTLFNTNEQPQNNSSMYSNKQVDQWLNEAQTMPNGPDRFDLYQKATIQIMKDAPWAPMYYGKYIYAIQPWVHGYYINPSLMDPLQWIWIDQSHSQS